MGLTAADSSLRLLTPEREKTTTNKISEVEKQKSTGVRPQIISPIYGAGNDSSASAISCVFKV